MANVLGISYGSVQNILKDDLGMPRILTEDQMENRKLIAAELFKLSVSLSGLCKVLGVGKLYFQYPIL